MATVTLSGYLTTATAITWASGQALDSLTDNEWTDLSDEIDNSANKYAMADIMGILASAAFTGTDSAIEIYIVKSVDGSTYPNWTGNVTTDEQENQQYFIGLVKTSGATAAQNMQMPHPIVLPNGKFKFGFRNRSNITLAASGNTFYWRPHSVA